MGYIGVLTHILKLGEDEVMNSIFRCDRIEWKIQNDDLSKLVVMYTVYTVYFFVWSKVTEWNPKWCLFKSLALQNRQLVWKRSQLCGEK